MVHCKTMSEEAMECCCSGVYKTSTLAPPIFGQELVNFRLNISCKEHHWITVDCSVLNIDLDALDYWGSLCF